MKRSNLFIFVAICFLPVLVGFHDDGSYNHLPPGAGGAGPYPVQNMEFLGRLPISEIGGGTTNVNVNDCWGWTDPLDGKEYAIIGLFNRASFVDISNPKDPKFLGFVRATGNEVSTWRDMKVFNNHVFIVADAAGQHGMQVFDLTRLRNANPNNPQDFSIDGFYPSGSFHNIAINEDTGFAYLVGNQNSADGGLHIVDINNPTNPTFVNTFADNNYTHDCQVVIYNGPDTTYAGREIAFCANGPVGNDAKFIPDTFAIVDVTNKNSINTIASETYGESRYSHQCWLSEDHRFLFHGDELDESAFGGSTRTLVWDIQDLDNPVYLGFYSGPNESIDHNAYVKGNYLYLANYTSGLRVVEFNPANVTPGTMNEVASIDTFTNDNSASFEGAWSCYPFFQSGVIVTSDIQSGLILSRVIGANISFPSGFPVYVDPAGQTLQIGLSDAAGSPVASTLTLHVDTGNGFVDIPATQISGSLYEAEFPPALCGSTVNYYVSVETTFGGQVETAPSCAPNDFYSVGVGGTVSTYEDNFETDQSWTVSGNADDGQWNRGVPAGGGDRGDPAIDADGSGQCFLTDNVDGNSDVDGGSTILTSPILDGSAAGSVLSYYRWYSNDFGGGPNEDIFEVEISNDGGSTWTNLETVGPAGPETGGGWFRSEFLISDVLTPTANMRIRFIATDDGAGSVVEAGVDGILIELDDCEIEPVIVPPANANVFRGILVSGSSADLADSDDVFAGFNPGFTLNSQEAPVWIVLDANLPSDAFSELQLQYESQANTPGLSATLEAFNWSSNSYDVVDTSAESFNVDSTVSVDLSTNASDYVLLGTADVRARIGWRRTGFTILFPWETRLDYVFWTAN